MKLAIPWSAKRKKPRERVHFIGNEYGLQRVCSVLSIIIVECKAQGIAYLKIINTNGSRRMSKKIAFKYN